MRDIPREIADQYQDFFNMMNQEHGLTLTISEMDEIIYEALKVHNSKPIKSTQKFEDECEIYIDTKSDEWVFKHKGVIKKRAKSKFECLMVKQEIKKKLNV